MRHAQTNCGTAATVFEVKQLIVLFNLTLQGYGYNVNRLFDIVLDMRERYTALLAAEFTKVRCALRAPGAGWRAGPPARRVFPSRALLWWQAFVDIFKADDYAPVQAENDAAFKAALASFPMDDRTLFEAPYPRTFPFSCTVPKVYRRVQTFIDDVFKFVEDLDLSQTEIDEIVRRAVNRVLTKTLGGAAGGRWRPPPLADDPPGLPMAVPPPPPSPSRSHALAVAAGQPPGPPAADAVCRQHELPRGARVRSPPPGAPPAHAVPSRAARVRATRALHLRGDAQLWQRHARDAAPRRLGLPGRAHHRRAAHLPRHAGATAGVCSVSALLCHALARKPL